MNEQDRIRAEEAAALRGEMFEDTLALEFPTRQSVGLDPATPLDLAAEFAADNMSAEAFAQEIDRIINGGA